MTLLKSEPLAPVRSLEELFALAHGMELDSAERYAELAASMRSQGSEELAALFDRLSAEEREHADVVVGLSVEETGAPPQPAHLKWTPPDAYDLEGVDATDPRLLSEYRALAVAVRNEERAFAFWSYVAAHAESDAVRQAAERMARIELDHVSQLRRRRRHAFHVQRRARGVTAAPATGELERRLADACERLAQGSAGDLSTRLAAMAAEAREMAEEAAAAGFPAPVEAGPMNDAETDPLGLAEALVDRYLEAAELADREATVAKAQAMASRAIARLAWLRTNLPADRPR